MVELNLEFVTKVLPPRRKPDVLRRQRLVNFFHEHIDRKVQLVTAPPGYGKTTLLADFATDSDLPICWYFLDDGDRDPRVFLETLLTSMRYRFPNFGQKTEARLANSPDCVREAAQIVGTLAGEIYADIPVLFFLVLEDYYSVESDGAINSIMDLIIERAPENCRFIISSRSAPDLPALAKLRLGREVAALDGADLAFTVDEVTQLPRLRSGRSELSEEDARKLVTESEGWIAGILLGVPRLSKTLGTEQGGASGEPGQISSEDVFQYLASEVYGRQPDDIKGFLLLSSTFREFAPEHCDRLFKLKNSAQFLERVEKRNLFISRLEGKRVLYKYHALFRGFLQEKLRKEQPDTYLLLHREAGVILEEQSQWNQAVEHYLAASAYPDALRIIKARGESYLKAGRWQTLSTWIQALPEGVRQGEPALCLFEVESLVHLGHVDRALQALNPLLSRLDETRDWLPVSKALSWRSAAFRLTGNFEEAMGDIKKSISLLTKNGSPPDVLGDAYRRLGNIHLEQGRLAQADKCLRRSLRLFIAVFDVNQIGAVHNSLGVVCKRRGELAKATAHYKEAVQYWEKAKNFGALALTLNNLGVAYYRQGQYDLALENLKTGLEKARASGYLRTEAIICNSLADVQRDLGLYEDALSAYGRAIELAKQVLEPYRVTVATAGIGAVYGLLGRLERAETLLKEAIAQAEERQQSYDVGIFNLRLGIVRCQQGKYEGAEKILAEVHDQMERLGDKDAVARCAVHLAQVSYLSKRRGNAIRWLGKVCELARDLGYEEFLAVEGRGMDALFRYAVSKRIGGGLYERAIARAEKLPLPSEQVRSPQLETIVSDGGAHQLEAHALGESLVVVDSRLVEDGQWRSTKAKEMLFYLLCHSGRVDKEQILASVWPDVSQARANSTFHSNLYWLRRALFDSVIVSQNGSYAVNPDVTIWFDVRQFEDNLLRARESTVSEKDKMACLEKAIDVYKGPLLKEFYSEWVEVQRRELEKHYLRGLDSLAGYYQKAGQYIDAIQLLEKSIATDPYFDDTYYELAKCYLATGDRNSALRVCRSYEILLQQDMGAGPSPRMEKLIESVRSPERVAMS